MRPWLRWSLAIVGSAAAFIVSWWVCQVGARLDEGVALGIAGAVLAVVLLPVGWLVTRERPPDEAKQSLQTGFNQLSVYSKWLIAMEHSNLSQRDRTTGQEYGTMTFQAIDDAIQEVHDPEVSGALERVKDESWKITVAIMQGMTLPNLGPLQSGRDDLKRVVKTRMRIKV